MKMYVSILLAAVLSASLLAGCGGSDQSGQQMVKKAKAQAAAAEDDTKAADGETANSDAYLVYVKDAETMAAIPGARVQFCSDTLCQMGQTDENGLAAFHSEPGTYSVHFLKAPEGYVKSTEEFTLDQDNREAIYFLEKEGAEKEGAEPEAAADADPAESAESDSVIDFPLTGFTFSPPEEFKHVSGEIVTNDVGEFDPDSGVVIGYVGYQAKNMADVEAFLKAIGVETVEDLTDEKMEELQKFYADTPTLLFFRVMGVRGDQDLEKLKKEMYSLPVKVFDEVGTAGDYKFYYVVLEDESIFEELRDTAYPQDRLEEAYKFWQEAATTTHFQERITVKEPESLYPSLEDGASVSFETQDLEGNPVTSAELFAGHKITMINFWATWCSNCKVEMPELEALNKEWADLDCQIIGICDDAEDDEMSAMAQRILKERGASFRNVRATDEIREQLPAVGMPTSYFVDSEGNILSAPILGRNVEQYSETLQELLSEME